MARAAATLDGAGAGGAGSAVNRAVGVEVCPGRALDRGEGGGQGAGGEERKC